MRPHAKKFSWWVCFILVYTNLCTSCCYFLVQGGNEGKNTFSSGIIYQVGLFFALVRHSTIKIHPGRTRPLPGDCIVLSIDTILCDRGRSLFRSGRMPLYRTRLHRHQFQHSDTCHPFRGHRPNYLARARMVSHWIGFLQHCFSTKFV